MSREYTTEEIREMFLNHVRHLIDYWRDQNCSTDDKVSGVAFSILVALDGGTDLPEFIIAPNPHPDDQSYAKASYENYFPENHMSNVRANIGGFLHELLNK